MDESAVSTVSIHHPYFKNFLLYSLMNFTIGILDFLGLLIPYYEAIEPQDSSYYSNIIFAQSVGYFLGCFSSKYLEAYFTFHKIAAFGGTTLMVSLIGFTSTSTLVFRTIFFFFTGLGNSYINIYPIKLCLECFKGPSLNRWIQLLELFVTIGQLSSSLIVFILGIYTPLFVSFIGLMIAIISLKIPSPENRRK